MPRLAGPFERMVDDIRGHLRARTHLPFDASHIEGLLVTVYQQYSLFSSYAHGGWQPVGWISADANGIMVSAFPSAIRSLSALVLAETLTQIVMVHLALRGMNHEANVVVRLQQGCFPPSMTDRIIAEFEKWQKAEDSINEGR